MPELALNRETIEHIKQEGTKRLIELFQDDLIKIILYGSCARGDYSADSDIDMAIITKSDRTEALKYNRELASIATDLAMRYFAIVNFVCLPQEEFLEKKSWYEYFKNIETEGEVLYG